ncbi:hypothetical protein TrST_g8241 [Triparma strigata]|uniref:Uncharacterized protein n=1 Tax=Triparma strigata TaxID=1606541 RepID=A0A9W6ZCX4_9STRA|nr:hypothetical protein TrST_g8241 [Triparma strigata]
MFPSRAPLLFAGFRGFVFPLLSARAFGSKTPGLVLNHSTHIPCLIPFLRRLLDEQSLIKKVVPGRLSRSRSSIDRFTVRVTSDSLGGFKCLAREGTLVQEVFFSTPLSREELEGILQEKRKDNRTSRREGKGEERRKQKALKRLELERELRDATSQMQRAEIRRVLALYK